MPTAAALANTRAHTQPDVHTHTLTCMPKSECAESKKPLHVSAKVRAPHPPVAAGRAAPVHSCDGRRSRCQKAVLVLILVIFVYLHRGY